MTTCGHGAKTIIDRNELTAPGGQWVRALGWRSGYRRWETLAGIWHAGVWRERRGVWQRRRHGGQHEVLPFILRGVNLLGIDSLPTPIERRRIVWERLAQLMPTEKLDRMMTVVRLNETYAGARDSCGRTRGRIVVDVNA